MSHAWFLNHRLRSDPAGSSWTETRRIATENVARLNLFWSAPTVKYRLRQINIETVFARLLK